MSDYSSTYTESTGDTIDTTDFSTEFNAIETAVATKYDSADLLDEDDMASNSATKFPSQQSTKAYVDNRARVTILDAPEVLATGLTEDAWTTVNSATLNTATATHALIRIAADEASGSSFVGRAFIRQTGSALAAAHQTMIAAQSQGGTVATYMVGESWVKLDASFDFDYFITAATTGTIDNTSLILVGYIG